MAVASSNGNAPTTGGQDAAELLSPTLPSYRPSTPPVAEHLLLDMSLQRAHCCLRSFCRRKRNAHHDDASTVDWASARRACMEWLKNPMNTALLLWLLFVGVSGGMLALLLLGLLDGAFPAPAERNRWIEINNQVLNALFTLMSLYQHPVLCHHLFLLCRWRPRDAADLRAAYCKCKGAAPRPGERAHMAVVVALLHLTVACQYVLCGLYWGYTESARPDLAEDVFFALGVLAPVAAAVYTACSPLGKGDQHHDLACSDSDTPTQPIGHVVVVVEPEWAGGMFDCGGGAASTCWCLSLPCTFCCVFGRNMERLGFGNAHLHAATLALLCLAPLWVLGVSALHIHDVVIGDTVGAAGVLLCAGGLIYGGYWRIQMRRRFGLPGSGACCGSESLTDYARWLLCWPCALAQEVRTASLYHVHGETLYSKVADSGHEERQPLLLAPNNSDHDVFRATDNGHLVVVGDETTTVAPPVQVVVVQQVDGDKSDERSVPLHSSSFPTSVTTVRQEDAALSEPNRAMAEDADRSVSSDGSRRMEKVKKMINMITLVSLLILLYTRGIVL